MSAPVTNPTPESAPAAPVKARKWPWVLGIGVALFVGIGIGNSEHAAPASTQQPDMKAVGDQFAAKLPAYTPPPPAPAGPLTTIPEGGPYEIGTASDQVPPGTYRTTGPTGRNPMGCYWERDSDTSGNSDSIIANDLTKGAATVTIGSTDGAFKTSSCQPWTKIK